MKQRIELRRKGGEVAIVTACPFCNHATGAHNDVKGCTVEVVGIMFGERFQHECMCDSGDGQSRK